ncbi:MAG: ATP-dependent metallopeptidase FtsH/Yme1/Tma family protein, partial [Cyanobacteria bacterium P01_D01_bin.2]
MTKSTHPSTPRSLSRRATRSLATGWFLLQTLLVAPLVTAQPAAAQVEGAEEPQITYGQLLEKLDQGEVERVELDNVRGVANVRLKGDDEQDPLQPVTLFANDIYNQRLLQRLRSSGVDYEVL